jgi:DNA primase
LLSTLQRQIIYVPDRDKAGLQVCERALDLGYKISLPEWDKNIKDVNDAVVKYGKFNTIQSILQNTTTSLIKLEMYRRKFTK